MTTSLKQVLELLDEGLTDSQLLARFISTRDESSFGALVRRHGPMVLGVCRRVLRNPHDAEDAFQATFLVLARKATSVLKRESVGCWLHGVAYNTALRAATATARRRAMERQVEEMPHPEVEPAEPQDWLPLLDRELSRLPKKYHAAIVACDLEGRSRKEAAELLGVCEGTLSSRLATGRRMLARRLGRSGLVIPGLALVPAPLVWSTAKAASGQLSAVSTTAVILTNEVMKAMLMKKLRPVVGAILVAVMLGVVGLGYRVGDNPAVAQTAPQTELEALRKENELLKLNLQVVLEKVRSQEAELRARRELGGPAGGGGGAAPKGPATGGAGIGLGPGGLGGGRELPPAGGGGPPGPGSGPAPGRTPPPGIGGGAPTGGAPDLFEEAEAAIKALREARDKEAKRRATEALEKVMKRLREQAK